MSPAGDATYMQDCQMCHTNGSEQNLPIGLNAVQDPQGWIQGQPETRCSPLRRLAADVTFRKGESAHFLANTDVLGESCNVCHAAGAQFAVDAVHAQ
jgi:cytochrome c5